jgi:DnaJ-class molecular chaperone
MSEQVTESEQAAQALPRMTACPMCSGYGIRDNGRACRTCGGCGELFNGLKFAEYQRVKKAGYEKHSPR